MNNANLHLLFNTRYFSDKELDFSLILSDRKSEKYKVYFEKKNEAILSRSFNISVDGSFIKNLFENLQFDNSKSFCLKILNPGLLIGAGYSHEIKYKGEIKLGFSFDYTSGLPYIPGSSIKGVLRSIFPDWSNQRKIRLTDKALKIKENQTFFLLNFIHGIKDKNSGSDPLNQKYISAIENEIFNGIVNDNKLSIYQRDVFFDAMLENTKNTEILDKETITPHFKKGIPLQDVILKEPDPITFIKVRPGISFRFGFYVHDNTAADSSLLSPSLKLKLFMHVLTTIGIGAKTNVGFGQLSE
ncbi:MAG: type III-B CRISPR module RAMP protein Cmr6 [Bacteroidia bacterium]|nr:type III-B CRISPR module RAMP protein Cmr6 [Bacteroidia bacterium]